MSQSNDTTCLCYIAAAIRPLPENASRSLALSPQSCLHTYSRHDHTENEKDVFISQNHHQHQHSTLNTPCGGDSLPDAAVERRSAYSQVSRQQGRDGLIADLTPVRHETAQGVQPTVRRGVVNGGSMASRYHNSTTSTTSSTKCKRTRGRGADKACGHSSVTSASTGTGVNINIRLTSPTHQREKHVKQTSEQAGIRVVFERKGIPVNDNSSTMRTTTG